MGSTTSRKRGDQLRPTLSLVVLAALIGSLLLLIWTGLNDREGEETATAILTPTPAVSTGAATSPSPLPEQTPTVPQPQVDIGVLQSQAEQAIRTYASFPNRQGRVATLDLLRPLVAPEALAAIDEQWSGPDVKTVEILVSDIVFEPDAFRQAESQVILQAVVTQQATFAKTPAQVYLPTVLATFEVRDGRWMIVELRVLGT